MFQDIKKIELHLHLDGSVKINTAEKLLNEKNLKDKMIVKENNKDLTEYLTKFDIPIKLMQNKDNLVQISKELIETLEKDNVIYVEIRFAPIFSTKEGLTLDEVIQSVLKGLKNNKVKTNLILCMMRGLNKDDNIKIIDLANKYLNKGVCAIDLAGDEIKYPTNIYKELFEYANKLKVPFTIHAGEAGTYKDIDEAISYKAKRIGHGIKAIENNNTISKIIENNISLEICPTSNIQTNVIKSRKKHPIKELINKGIKVTINTDNRTVSNTSLEKEYELLSKTFNFSKEDFKIFNKNALQSAFLSNEEKEELLKELSK